jgi:hypothetical protein
MDTRNNERDLDRPSEKGRVAGDRRHQESPDREAPIGNLKPSGYRGSWGRVICALQKCEPRNPDGEYGQRHMVVVTWTRA